LYLHLVQDVLDLLDAFLVALLGLGLVMVVAVQLELVEVQVQV
jgi:hypothetical protein